jgi:DNA-directed RNA polymerase specialized sigma subunit
MAIKSFKLRYRQILESDYDDEVRPIDKITITVILNELDEFDQNILIAYYAIADSSSTKLAKVFGVAPSVITSRINKIQKYVRTRSAAIAANCGIHY